MYNSRKPAAEDLPSTGQLLRSTAIAAAAALVILVTVVLPAEYGIDATGVGRVIGLTQMGEMKLQLAREAAADGAAATPSRSAATHAPAPARTPAATAPAAAAKSDEIAVTLKPGQAAEVKVEMRKGTRIAYRWTAGGGRLNFDTHGDPYNAPRNFYHGYGKGTGAGADQGTLEAAFDGFHGWFWRNRTSQSVTVTLHVEGDYIMMKRVL